MPVQALYKESLLPFIQYLTPISPGSHELRSSRARILALSISASLLLSMTPALANPPKPTIAQIEAAKKAEAEKKKAADAAAAVLNKANLTL